MVIVCTCTSCGTFLFYALLLDFFPVNLKHVVYTVQIQNGHRRVANNRLDNELRAAFRDYSTNRRELQELCDIGYELEEEIHRERTKSIVSDSRKSTS